MKFIPASTGAAMSDEVILKDDHVPSLTEDLSRFYTQGFLTDITLSTEDGKNFEAHRILLAARSHYFHAIVPRLKHESVIFLKGVKGSYLDKVLKFIYAGTISVPRHQLKPMLEVARSLQVKGLQDMIPSELCRLRHPGATSSFSALAAAAARLGPRSSAQNRSSVDKQLALANAFKSSPIHRRTMTGHRLQNGNTIDSDDEVDKNNDDNSDDDDDSDEDDSDDDDDDSEEDDDSDDSDSDDKTKKGGDEEPEEDDEPPAKPATPPPPSPPVKRKRGRPVKIKPNVPEKVAALTKNSDPYEFKEDGKELRGKTTRGPGRPFGSISSKATTSGRRTRRRDNVEEVSKNKELVSNGTGDSSSQESTSSVSHGSKWHKVQKLSSASAAINGQQVLTVTCKGNMAELHLARFASGVKGASIFFKREWMTPQEFEHACGSTGKRYLENIQTDYGPLKTLTLSGMLKPHSRKCRCSICRGDEPPTPSPPLPPPTTHEINDGCATGIMTAHRTTVRSGEDEDVNPREWEATDVSEVVDDDVTSRLTAAATTTSESDSEMREFSRKKKRHWVKTDDWMRQLDTKMKDEKCETNIPMQEDIIPSTSLPHSSLSFTPISTPPTPLLKEETSAIMSSISFTNSTTPSFQIASAAPVSTVSVSQSMIQSQQPQYIELTAAAATQPLVQPLKIASASSLQQTQTLMSPAHKITEHRFETPQQLIAAPAQTLYVMSPHHIAAMTPPHQPAYEFDLKPLLKPQSIAVSGASKAPVSRLSAVMQVRCKSMTAYMYTGKYESGSKGKCIQLVDEWLTPNEFEERSGSKAKKYLSSIKCLGRPLRVYVNSGELRSAASMSPSMMARMLGGGGMKMKMMKPRPPQPIAPAPSPQQQMVSHSQQHLTIQTASGGGTSVNAGDSLASSVDLQQQMAVAAVTPTHISSAPANLNMMMAAAAGGQPPPILINQTSMSNSIMGNQSLMAAQGMTFTLTPQLEMRSNMS